MIAVLVLRTLSQALQALTPIALSLTWFERTGDTGTSSAIRRGLVISIPATVVASWLFQLSTRRAFDEALLAAMTVAVTAIFAWRVWRAAESFPVVRVTNRDRASRRALTALAALIVVRQMMEIGSVLTAAIDLRLFVPTATVLGALTAGGCAAWGMRRLGPRLQELKTMAERLLAAEHGGSTTRWNGWTPRTCSTPCRTAPPRSPMSGWRRSTAARRRGSFFRRLNHRSSSAELA